MDKTLELLKELVLDEKIILCYKDLFGENNEKQATFKGNFKNDGYVNENGNGSWSCYQMAGKSNVFQNEIPNYSFQAIPKGKRKIRVYQYPFIVKEVRRDLSECKKSELIPFDPSKLGFKKFTVKRHGIDIYQKYILGDNNDTLVKLHSKSYSKFTNENPNKFWKLEIFINDSFDESDYKLSEILTGIMIKNHLEGIKFLLYFLFESDLK